MIQQLDHTAPSIAKQMKIVFHASYAVEGALLKAVDFPPLKRQLEQYMNTDTNFYGFWVADELAGVIELQLNPTQIHIQSLVVHPNFFRRGIGKQLVQFVFDSFTAETYMVETGAANGPAIALYQQLGFKEVLQWDTTFGIRKVRFEKKS